ncbi:MAG: primosomal protein N', partial [Thermoleophilaceae bacterium]|nr:primosomal protein N' [Thermoleophilaceae bacterium]
GTHTTLRALERRGLVTLEQQAVRRRPPVRPVGGRSDVPHVLSADQAAALAAVLALLDQPDAADRRLLLHGVTGSGKTEVYLAAVAAVLERRRSAIVLVPEIALTPQTASRFQQRFGDTVAILHSQLSDGERYDEWLRLRRGEARVCVGPRSAVFAPLEQLGLIVIDEEHDGSYKQEGDPRYDARRVAELRAGSAGAVLLAGSATPRPESWVAFPRLSMPDRVDSLPLPAVEVVGMAGIEGALHPRTVDALAEIRERRSKAIVMLNRRGWSNFVACHDCGHTWGCPNCDVTLVLHQAAGRISCHHCGHSQKAPRACSECGSVSVGRHGIGTERLEHELDRLLAPLEVLRLDSDTGSGREATARLLERFEALDAGVLIGTQMVAKGHDFPDVALGVVLDADATLRFPDFRAEERTFSLVAQLAGRSGRGPGGGRVLVQALDPDAECLALAAAHDAPAFLACELERRAALRYPPFGELIRVVCSCSERGPELEVATLLAERIVALAPEATIAGPAPLFRLKGRERSQLLVKSESRSAAVRAVREAVEATAAEPISGPVAFAVDVDPQ